MIHLEALQAALHDRIARQLAQHPPQRGSCAVVEAVNRISAEAVLAPLDVPRHTVSAMDGYALAQGSDLCDGAVFTVVGESVAGRPFAGTPEPQQAVRIMTGAVLPGGCDTVVMQENVQRDGAQMMLSQPARLGSNIRHQGEEIRAGQPVLSAGTRLTPAHVSLLSSLGLAEVAVYRPVRVGLLASGDELVAAGQPLDHAGQIYNSNTPALLALLRDLPVTLVDCGVLPDALQPTQEALLAAAAHCDVVVTSAGVSVGDYDFLTQAITAVGQIEHYKVALKPGKPFVFGCIHQPEHPVLYVGLPGNPLSTFLGAWLVLRPMLWQLAGQAPLSPPLVLQARLTQPVAKRPGRREFQRARLTCAADGWTVTPFAAQDSHRVLGLAEANALIDLPEACAGVAAGDWVAVRPLGWGFDL